MERVLMRQKKLRGIKLPVTCPCGSPNVVRKFGEFWTCQRCLDLDAISNSLHERARREYMALSQEEALQAYHAAPNKRMQSYYKHHYRLDV